MGQTYGSVTGLPLHVQKYFSMNQLQVRPSNFKQ